MNNLDIWGLVRRIDRAIMELQASVSSGLNMIKKPDIKRWRAYAQEWKAKKAQFTPLDSDLEFPKSHPESYPMSAEPTFVACDNEMVNDLQLFMLAMRKEMALCQSNRLEFGMMDPDSNRFEAMVKKIDEYITYMENESPQDYVESSPLEPGPLPGRTEYVTK